MRLLVVALAILIGCRDERASKPPRDPTPGSAVVDPWAVETKPDDSPSLAERQKLAEQACPVIKAAYFYRIEKNGKTSHLLGTRHVSIPLAKMPRPVHDAMAAANLAVLETGPDDSVKPEHPKLVLRDALGPELFKHYEELVGSDIAHRLEEATAPQAAIVMAASYEDVTAMLDDEIENKMVEAGVPIQGLETHAFQDRLIHELFDLRMLKAAIKHTKNRDEIREHSQRNIQTYCTGIDDAPGMDEEDRDDMREAGYTDAEIEHFDEAMIYSRNVDWIPKLEKILETDHVFIAVGRGHVIGPRGIVALLQNHGYKLTRIAK